MKKKPTSLRRSMFMRLGFNFYDVAVTIFCVAFGLLCFLPALVLPGRIGHAV